MKKNLLLTPGPTQIPPDICEALGRPIIHHRTPQFQDNLKSAIEGLKYIFQTKKDVFILAGSGTAGMEAGVVNLCSPGDKVITVEGGKFGERWTELCQAYGISAQVIQVPWGHALKPAQVRQILDAHKDIKAVFITHCETSTGVTTDVKAIAEVVSQTGAVLVVDAVSSLGVTDLQMDNWKVDVVVSASHKGLMCPPGLAFVAVSEKAMKLIEQSHSPRYYFDLRKSKKAIDKNDTPFTPAIGIVIALIQALKRIKEEGLENRLAHFTRLADATRSAAKALGLTLYADESCISNVLTAINVPPNIEGEKIMKIMRDTYGISIAGGQSELKGKIIRIAHMGCVDEYDILAGLSCLEKVLKELGYRFTLGAGVSAAQQTLNK